MLGFCEPTKHMSNAILLSFDTTFPKEGLNGSKSLFLRVELLAEKDMNCRIIESFRPRDDFGFELGPFCNFLAEQIE